MRHITSDWFSLHHQLPQCINTPSTDRIRMRCIASTSLRWRLPTLSSSLLLLFCITIPPSYTGCMRLKRSLGVSVHYSMNHSSDWSLYILASANRCSLRTFLVVTLVLCTFKETFSDCPIHQLSLIHDCTTSTGVTDKSTTQQPERMNVKAHTTTPHTSSRSQTFPPETSHLKHVRLSSGAIRKIPVPILNPLVTESTNASTIEIPNPFHANTRH